MRQNLECVVLCVRSMRSSGNPHLCCTDDGRTECHHRIPRGKWWLQKLILVAAQPRCHPKNPKLPTGIRSHRSNPVVSIVIFPLLAGVASRQQMRGVVCFLTTVCISSFVLIVGLKSLPLSVGECTVNFCWSFPCPFVPPLICTESSGLLFPCLLIRYIVVLLSVLAAEAGFAIRPYQSRAIQNHDRNTNNHRISVSTPMVMTSNQNDAANENGSSIQNSKQQCMTILGIGSLLSEKSSRLTFPTLQNFRLGRVSGYRRVFRHTPASFFTKGIASLETMEMASLSAERVPDSSSSTASTSNTGFICSVFEVPTLLSKDGVPNEAFREREEAFTIETKIRYLDLSTNQTRNDGVLCTSSTDDAYIRQWGEDRFQQKYGGNGSTSPLTTLWGWGPDSGLKPCRVYLRHCVLAAKKLGPEALDSFLDETYLIDRTTTIREYLTPDILETVVPNNVAIQYGGE